MGLELGARGFGPQNQILQDEDDVMMSQTCQTGCFILTPLDVFCRVYCKEGGTRYVYGKLLAGYAMACLSSSPRSCQGFPKLFLFKCSIHYQEIFALSSDWKNEKCN